jgi:Ca2+-binding EF-hand superfamily protein
VPLNEVEDIHKVFRKYDTDGSGAIEYEEFQELMFQLLGVTERNDYPMERMKQFWQAIDLDGGGEVDFEEFLIWFRKYFLSSDGKMSRNPAESFYAQLQSARMPRLQEEGGINPFWT